MIGDRAHFAQRDNAIAKAIFQVDGIARVQAITRPEGTPIEHTCTTGRSSNPSAKCDEANGEHVFADMREVRDGMSG